MSNDGVEDFLAKLHRIALSVEYGVPDESERRAAARLHRTMADATRDRYHAARALRAASECDHEADMLALADLDLSAEVCGWSAVAALAGEAP